MGGGNQNQNNNNNNNNNFESQSSSTNNNNSSHQHPLFNHQWFANPYQQQQQQTQQQPYNEEDANVQKRLLEHYNQEKQRQESQVLIDSQYESALERFPESFAHVNMLYVDGKLNNTALKMFVDSGAQSSIISYDVAKKCGIAHLIDQRFAGIAKGVGAARILGKIHLANLSLGDGEFEFPLQVIDNPDMDFLLGLDFMRKYQGTIDLEKNALRLGRGLISVPFLAEKDLFETPETQSLENLSFGMSD